MTTIWNPLKRTTLLRTMFYDQLKYETKLILLSETKEDNVSS